MAEDQGINPENNADVVNSSPDAKKTKKSHNKRRQVTEEKKKSKNVLVCVVFLLDGTELAIEVEKNALGEVLFSKVVENLDIVDKEYFGLRFVNTNASSICWLHHHKQIRKQLKIGELKFQFAVKFYEPEPGKHLDEYTRYLLYLQLREDIVYGRLGCPTRTYVLLASFTAQAEFGDHDIVEHGVSYLDDYQLGPEEAEEEANFVKRVIDLHQEHRGQTPAEAELNFLEVAKRTPRYGVDIHHAKDKKGVPIEVGVSHKGVVVFKEGEAVDSYGWRAIDIVAYKRKRFMLKLFSAEKRKNPQFKSNTRRDAKNLYKSAIEHHSFFRLTVADPARRRSDSFVIGSKFRYSDRTLYQIRSDPTIRDRPRPQKFTRGPSKRQTVKSRKQRVRPAIKDIVADEPKKEEKEPTEPEGQFEEIEIDESNPDDDRYKTQEWEIIEKVLEDGTKKRYRRRIITTTTTKPTYVIRKGTEEMGHVMEDKPIEGSPEPEPEPVEDVQRESPEVVPAEDESYEHRHEVITTTVITKERVLTPESNEDDGLGEIETPKPMSQSEIRAAAKKPSAAVKPLMREDLDTETTTTTTTTKTKVLVYDPEKEETVKVVTKEDREEELRKKQIEEELQRLEEIRIRNEREAATRRKYKEEQERKEQERKRREEGERRKELERQEEERQRLRAMSPEFQTISLSTGNEEFDKEFGIKGMDTFMIKTSPMPSQFMRELDEELNASKDDDDDDDIRTDLKEDKTDFSLDIPVVEDTRKSKTLDRKFVRRPPPEKSSGYIRRSYGNELDFDYSPGSGARTMPRKMRKYVPLITKEELVRAYSSGGLHDESVKRETPEEEKSKIEYSLKDESGVEQGEQGFVKNLIGRHETIKSKGDEELEERRKSRVYSSSDQLEGVVPTRSTSFANVDKPEVKKTKVPPPVKTKPVIFNPDKSRTSPATKERPSSAYELSSPPESAQANRSEEIRKYPIPEVVTTSVVYDSNASPERGRISDNVLVSTHTVSVSPAETSSNSIITPPPPDVINHSDPSNSAPQDTTDDFPSPPPDLLTQTSGTSSHPPQVETHTVVIGGDGTNKEDFERMISRESVTTSETTITKTMTTEYRTSEQTVVITGEGEVNADLQQALRHAAENGDEV